MQTALNKSVFYKSYYTFFVYGFMALILGVAINSVIDVYGVDFSMAGLFVAAHSAGGVVACFLCSALIGRVGYRKTALFLTSLVPLSYTGILFFSHPAFLLCFFFCSGVGLGSIANVNNALVNECAVGQSAPLNILHTFFALGAFSAPLAASVIAQLGFSWRITLFFGIVLCLSMTLTYASMNLDFMDKIHLRNTPEPVSREVPIYRTHSFIIASCLLFFYMGAEISINGWLITYLQKAGIVGTIMAQNLLSALWIVIIAGRLACVYLSYRIAQKNIVLINASFSVLFFILLVTAKSAVTAAIGIVGIGFFFAGIFPTTLACVGALLTGRRRATATLLAVASMGGILTPALVGGVAESLGIVMGMGVIVADVFFMFIAALVLRFSRFPG